MIKPTSKDLKNATRANIGKPFADADDAQICELHAQRVSVATIAERLGRTEATIKARFQRLGLKGRA